MSNHEYVMWAVYHGRRAQRQQMDQAKADARAARQRHGRR